MALSEEDIASSLSEPDQATKGFTFQQTMLRVKDPKVSLDLLVMSSLPHWGALNFAPSEKWTLIHPHQERKIKVLKNLLTD